MLDYSTNIKLRNHLSKHNIKKITYFFDIIRFLQKINTFSHSILTKTWFFHEIKSILKPSAKSIKNQILFVSNSKKK
ncbi:hypothetical protein SAMN04515674_101592 [Pseudarcicella hirudinis]|uniref:Uncharacterized protein n=1 Tax=Pseudarcicella hirudinis TaxID=1079859 RepID=A0A1I5N4M6_9BACT|nr:hypothetical protein SAMN04515674_101592 [Pseudarcicella hirudinis]